VKILPKSKYCDEPNDDVQNEFNILKTLDHPNILKQIEMFQDANNFYIVTEICQGGELFDELQPRPGGTFSTLMLQSC
jgi:calcium-dependent protein kinase